MSEAGDGGGEPLSAAWAGRALAGLCAAAGLYAATVALNHIRHGDTGGTWLLPLCAGALTVFLSICIAFNSSDATIAWRELGHRAAAMALLVAYAFVLLPLLGFLTASILLVLAIATLYASRRLFVGAGGVIMAVGMWALFAYALAEPLPHGLWWR